MKGRTPTFVRASRLYDVQAGEHVRWDWTKMQPLRASQIEVDRAVEAVYQEG